MGAATHGYLGTKLLLQEPFQCHFHFELLVPLSCIPEDFFFRLVNGGKKDFDERILHS